MNRYITVALGINGFTCLIYGIFIKKTYKNEKTNRKEIYILAGPIIAAILFTALYYIIRETVFLKNDKNANIVGWNVLYFVISIAIPFSPIFLP